MSYVEYCKKHGQYHGEICGECFYENGTDVLLLTERVTSLVSENLNLHEENTRLKDSIAVIYLENARLEAEDKFLREALMKIAVAEGRENYPQELWGAYLMDLARSALHKNDI